ncbi:uncharacterized protein LOC101749895 isoform X1 [Gallus gallus]|uniref:uncharacterized protein LOC101749895 isoform X1 n=1 Tax=Gallus gallus TaxID=9031 RepID=UPI001F0030C7|nr:uncharacterized protein LOC101749895 isoform X1 [Gallus gallus]
MNIPRRRECRWLGLTREPLRSYFGEKLAATHCASLPAAVLLHSHHTSLILKMFEELVFKVWNICVIQPVKYHSGRYFLTASLHMGKHCCTPCCPPSASTEPSELCNMDACIQGPTRDNPHMLIPALTLNVPAEQPCFPHLLAAPEGTPMDWAVQLPAALEYRLMFA